MATIKEKPRAEGLSVWQVSIRRRGYPTQYKTFRTKTEATKWASIQEAAVAQGTVHARSKETERTTLAEALTRYMTDILPAKKGSRQDGYRIQRWLRSDLAPRFLTAIQGKDVAAYRDARLKEGASPTTVHHELSMLSRVYTTALKEWSYVGLRNPVTDVRLPKLPQGRERRVSDKEIEDVLSVSESPLLAGIVRLAVNTAMRQEELTNMDWSHIDWDKNVLRIPVAKVEPRKIPLNAQALAVLRERGRQVSGKVWGILPHAVAVAWRRAVTRARAVYVETMQKKGQVCDPHYLVDLHFHDLRHEATSRFFELGLNPMQVAAITGHKTLEMLKRYTHLKAEDLATVIAEAEETKSTRRTSRKKEEG